MAVECPVCREPIPWHRLFFTTAWGSWRCGACDSLLAVDVRRRFLALGIGITVMFATTRVVRAPMSWDLPVVLIAMSVVMIPYFLFFERARILERRGFRCRDCGYDLQGQADPRCPECGRVFDQKEVARMGRYHASEQHGTRRVRRGWIVVVMLVLVFAATVLLVVGIATFKRTSNPQKAPGPSANPTPVAPATNPTGG